jgi:hypothetical protein
MDVNEDAYRKLPRKLHVNTKSPEERIFQKRIQNRYLWINNNNNKLKRKKILPY